MINRKVISHLGILFREAVPHLPPFFPVLSSGIIGLVSLTHDFAPEADLIALAAPQLRFVRVRHNRNYFPDKR